MILTDSTLTTEYALQVKKKRMSKTTKRKLTPAERRKETQRWKESIREQQDVRCTKGHEVQCWFGTSDVCECACGGRNHGFAVTGKARR